MKAADLMTTNVITIAEDATIQEAAALMLNHRISALPVVDRSGKLVGIVSEGDLVRRAAILASLLASATATLVGFRASNAVSQGRCFVPWILA